jgi:hypothetical protein
VGVWGSIGELGAHYMCEVRFGSVLRFQLGVQKGTFLPEMKILLRMCTHGSPKDLSPTTNNAAVHALIGDGHPAGV